MNLLQLRKRSINDILEGNEFNIPEIESIGEIENLIGLGIIEDLLKEEFINNFSGLKEMSEELKSLKYNY